MSKLRIATWNMDSWKRKPAAHADAWRWLQEALHPDVALLQETKPPRGLEQVFHRPNGIDRNRRWSSAIACSGIHGEEIRKWKGRYDWTEKDLQRTFPGSVIAAKIVPPHVAPIVVVSIYGLLDDGYAYTTVHRQFTDLNPLLDSRQSQRLIIGGDLNCSTQLEPPYRSIHRNLFERFELYGLVNLTKATKKDRPRLENCPCGEGPDCGHVQTQLHGRSKKPWQTDYIFASERLASELDSCEVMNGSPVAWQFSDHCPIVATFNL